jgi:NAD-dependent SIR2 family protein deacetylase
MIERAAEAIAHADALLIGAGAGMGVDSGMPDFRGPEGFWRAYPPYAKLGLRFEQMASPDHFRSDPPLGWGFYGHRTNLYRQTTPHPGFAILKEWADWMPQGAFVFTSNVDNHFQRAGFDPDRVVECHGSIEHRQCLDGCGMGIFDADPAEIAVDPSTFRAVVPLPSCPECGGLARPNILMFGDWDWDSSRTRRQRRRLEAWLGRLGSARLAVVELGAGRAIPTVRLFCESTASSFGTTLIRINVRESEVRPPHLGIPMGALAALRAIEGRLGVSPGAGLEAG